MTRGPVWGTTRGPVWGCWSKQQQQEQQQQQQQQQAAHVQGSWPPLDCMEGWRHETATQAQAQKTLPLPYSLVVGLTLMMRQAHSDVLLQLS